MRLAVVTPLDARSTGVADYSCDLLPHLAQVAGESILVYSRDGAAGTSDVDEGWSWRSINDLARDIREFDLVIYQMGNSPAHDFMAPYLFRYPGLVVLHDLSLHNFFARLAQAGHMATYLRAFGFGYGLEGTGLARRYLQTPLPVGYPQYLVSEWLAARSLAVIVHSHHAASILAGRCPLAQIHFVPMPMPVPPRVSQAEVRKQLGIASETYLMVVFGMLNSSKHPIETLEAVRYLRADGIPAQIVFVGQENSRFHLAPEVERRSLQASVTYVGFVDMAAARRWMFAADVAVGLRQLYFGETSASALRVLATGTPMVVTNVGAFAELPEPVCVRLPFGAPDLVQALCTVLAQLYRDPARRQAMGQAARDYVMCEHNPTQIAAQYLQVVEQVVGHR
jgi:glycosyltransferase involved in cell wall biosynthesis